MFYFKFQETYTRVRLLKLLTDKYFKEKKQSRNRKKRKDNIFIPRQTNPYACRRRLVLVLISQSRILGAEHIDHCRGFPQRIVPDTGHVIAFRHAKPRKKQSPLLLRDTGTEFYSIFKLLYFCQNYMILTLCCLN